MKIRLQNEDRFMDAIVDLFFEAAMLKKIPRSGYQFLGRGNESVAEHVFVTTFIAFVFSRMRPDIDGSRLIDMCLVHDLPEARTGDLNYVQKKYVAPDDARAVSEAVQNLPFGKNLAALVKEFDDGRTEEAKLARDADQLAFLIDLKTLADMGHASAVKWLPFVKARLQTPLGKQAADALAAAPHDRWWLKLFSNAPDS
jgi:putative hydrolase of HD superfamily